jgi:hypothetical protein
LNAILFLKQGGASDGFSSLSMVRVITLCECRGDYLGLGDFIRTPRGSGCRNLALPGVYEQVLPFFQLLPDFFLLNLTHTTLSR